MVSSSTQITKFVEPDLVDHCNSLLLQNFELKRFPFETKLFNVNFLYVLQGFNQVV